MGVPLTCVMEVHIGELHCAPAVLTGASVLQVFLELEASPEGFPEYADGAWHVETFKNVEGLLEQQQGVPLETEPVAWELLEHTYPNAPDNHGIVPPELEDAFHELPNASELEANRLRRILGTHIGGWPCWLTGSDVGEFVLQLDGETVGVNLGFDGQLYFGMENGTWRMSWEIG